MTQTANVTVIIPALNEAGNIQRLVTWVHHQAKGIIQMC